MKVNIYFDDNGNPKAGNPPETGIFFRYYDKNNYYCVKLNMKNSPRW